jgi:hypothetical protein
MALLYLAEGLVTGFTDGWYDWVQPSSLFVSVALDLSRFDAAPCARLSHLSFESDRAFPPQG